MTEEQDSQGRDALPAWLEPSLQTLLAQRGHAWLLAGASGLGQYALGLALCSAWLCDSPGPTGACGRCVSCHLIVARSHPDLEVLMPETWMLEHAWPLSEKAQAEIDEKKRKASREIRVDAMRDAIEFAQRTSARGRGKAVLVFPAERMNAVTANALLKTLEEPPGDVRFVLATEAAHLLLPTIRSRCMVHPMVWPSLEQATAHLERIGAAQASPWLPAAAGRPELALRMAGQGRDIKAWSALPQSLAQGRPGLLAECSPAEAVDALQKLCHDLWAVGVGADPRFFARADLQAYTPGPRALARWSRQLSDTARSVEHPLNAGLLLEALASQAQQVLARRTGSRAALTSRA